MIERLLGFGLASVWSFQSDMNYNRANGRAREVGFTQTCYKVCCSCRAAELTADCCSFDQCWMFLALRRIQHRPSCMDGHLPHECSWQPQDILHVYITRKKYSTVSYGLQNWENPSRSYLTPSISGAFQWHPSANLSGTSAEIPRLM